VFGVCVSIETIGATGDTGSSGATGATGATGDTGKTDVFSVHARSDEIFILFLVITTTNDRGNSMKVA